jgi:hypothetical protein
MFQALRWWPADGRQRGAFPLPSPLLSCLVHPSELEFLVSKNLDQSSQEGCGESGRLPCHRTLRWMFWQFLGVGARRGQRKSLHRDNRCQEIDSGRGMMTVNSDEIPFFVDVQMIPGFTVQVWGVEHEGSGLLEHEPHDYCQAGRLPRQPLGKGLCQQKEQGGTLITVCHMIWLFLTLCATYMPAI